MYSVCVDRDQSRLEQLDLLLFLIANVYNHLKLDSRFLTIYFLDLLSGRAPILRTFFSIHAGKGFCSDGV